MIPSLNRHYSQRRTRGLVRPLLHRRMHFIIRNCYRCHSGIEWRGRPRFLSGQGRLAKFLTVHCPCKQADRSVRPTRSRTNRAKTASGRRSGGIRKLSRGISCIMCGVLVLRDQFVVDKRGGVMTQHEAEWRAGARSATAGLLSVMGMILFLASASQPARSQTYTVIHNFTNQGTDGATPYGGPILDSSGNLYGTTYLGGEWGNGAVYKMSPN